jgi:hypothetical protein
MPPVNFKRFIDIMTRYILLKIQLKNFVFAFHL